MKNNMKKIEKIVIRFYKMKRDDMIDAEKLVEFNRRIASYDRNQFKECVIELSERKEMFSKFGLLFKNWCKLVSLRGVLL